jgi:hypothetical protein
MTDGNDKVVALQPKRPLTLKEALVKSLQESKKDQSEYFNEVYAGLLRAKADVAEAIAKECSDRRLAKLQDIEGEALWDVIHAHAIHRWQINHKLELLQELLHTGQNWFDQREFFLLASARMDLERLGPLAEAKRFTGESGDNDAA